MRRISDADELLDGPLDDPVALRGNLHDLARVNRRLGGATLSIRAVDALAGGRTSLDIIDIGTGAADIPVALLEHGARSGRTWRVTGVDSRPEVLAAAAATDRALTATPGLSLHVGDGRDLPFADDAFDVAHASLVVHHLEPDGVVLLLAEMARVARIGVVVNDLVRGRLALAGAWALTRVATRNRYTRSDAPLSVRRAYTRTELEGLVGAAGLIVVDRFDGFAGHRWAITAVRSGARVSVA
jgi:SAM-dependent methyltransferase